MHSKLARKRLVRDFRKLQSDPPYGVSGSPVNSNLLRWHAVIFGPDGTVWEGGTFRLEMAFNEDYPNKPPIVRFISRMFHPNVYMDGNICLDILQNQWSPIYDISAILISIQSLLSDPNPNSPANSEAASLFAENRREYNRRVQHCVADSWKCIDAAEETSDKIPSPTSGDNDGEPQLQSSSASVPITTQSMASSTTTDINAATGAATQAANGERGL